MKTEFKSSIEIKYDILRGENYQLSKELEYYRSGRHCEKIRTVYEDEIRSLRHQLEMSKKQLGKSREKAVKDKAEIDRLRNVIIEKQEKADELYQEYEKKISDFEKLIQDMEKQIKDLEEKNKKLSAQIKRDFTNSSTPSSQCPNRKKICNSRTQTDRKQGAQCGHTAHRRKQYDPGIIIELDMPDEVRKHPELYKKTNEIKRRDLIDMKVSVETISYHSYIYENILDHSRIFSPFPDGIVNETNYGKGIRAFALLLNGCSNVSIRKTSDVLRYISDGKITLSSGAIASLMKRFSSNSKEDIETIISSLYLSPYMHHDATYLRNNGKQEYVYVASNGAKVCYQHFERKNLESLEKTPVKDYQFTLIHDHDKNYFRYGTSHQKCLAHELRYLEDSIVNEPEYTWNSKMKELLQKAIHSFKNHELTDEDILKISDEYDQIIILGRSEYERKPASKYYTAGFNTFMRFAGYKKDILYFLHHQNIPYTNNEAERRLRKIKMKSKQVGSFRSSESLDHYCDFMSVIETAKSEGTNIYELMKQKL